MFDIYLGSFLPYYMVSPFKFFTWVLEKHYRILPMLLVTPSHFGLGEIFIKDKLLWHCLWSPWVLLWHFTWQISSCILAFLQSSLWSIVCMLDVSTVLVKWHCLSYVSLWLNLSSFKKQFTLLKWKEISLNAMILYVTSLFFSFKTQNTHFGFH